MTYRRARLSAPAALRKRRQPDIGCLYIWGACLCLWQWWHCGSRCLVASIPPKGHNFAAIVEVREMQWRYRPWRGTSLKLKPARPEWSVLRSSASCRPAVELRRRRSTPVPLRRLLCPGAQRLLDCEEADLRTHGFQDCRNVDVGGYLILLLKIPTALRPT